jgi:hypothetical protein
VSRDFFDDRIRPRVKVAMVGRRVLVSVQALEEWLDQNAIAIVA